MPTFDVLTAPQDCEAMPDKASEAFGVAVAVPCSKTGFGETLGASAGAVASRLMVTLCELVPPALVAMQVRETVGVRGNRLQGAPGLIGHGGFIVNHRPRHLDIARVPAVISERAGNAWRNQGQRDIVRVRWRRRWSWRRSRAATGWLQLEGSDIGSIRSIGYGRIIHRSRKTCSALVGRERVGCPLVDRDAPTLRSHRGCRASIILKRSEFELCCRHAYLIAGCGRDYRPARVAHNVVTLRSNDASHIRTNG